MTPERLTRTVCFGPAASGRSPAEVRAYGCVGPRAVLVRAGKIRYAGSSTFSPSAIVRAQWTAERRQRERFVCEQPPYSRLARGVEAEVLPTCETYRMGVLAWSPPAGGRLSGRWRRDAADPSSHRTRTMPFRTTPRSARRHPGAPSLPRPVVRQPRHDALSRRPPRPGPPGTSPGPARPAVRR
ncbi:aldo/keto reductase [Streptomyces sp. MB22_4]|uniref:aldo/keto reductase n=1 Tax=Streptomyces sp. MB22_4 TaxID=3383120 RepID=UPI0039A275C8